jgi:hypothetical protein
MKYLKYLLIVLVFLPALNSCSSAEKAAKERRNLMMPKKSELARNSKYKPAKAKKTYSQRSSKKSKR